MEWMLLAKAVLALVFVVGLIGACAVLAKRFQLHERLQGLGGASTGRLKVKESLMLDARRKLVIVQRDDTEHVLLLGPSGDTVVESNIEKKARTDESS